MIRVLLGFLLLKLMNASLEHLQSSFLINSLPGFNDPFPSRMYSGYLNVSSGSRLFFWFVEAEQDPENAPTTLWLNGGPGCSSLDGFWYEHGPFQFNQDGSLSIRPYRWSRLSNMLYIENPVGVGLSYSISESPDRYKNSDDRTPIEAAEALQFFFEIFPNLKKNPFFLSGESYAGIYVPTIAEQILSLVDKGHWVAPELKGIAVGNGCTGKEIGICGFYFGGSCEGLWYEYSFMEGFSFFSDDLKGQISAACDWQVCQTSSVYVQPTGELSEECLNLVESAFLLVSYVNTYNVFGACIIDSCDGPNQNQVMGRVGGVDITPFPESPYSLQSSSSSSPSMALQSLRKYRQKTTHNQRGAREGEGEGVLQAWGPNDDSLFDDSLSQRTQVGPAGCINSAQASAYMNRPEVLRALHARDPGFCWAICNQAPGFSYNITRHNLPRDTYPSLISRMKVVIFNGDWDACVPYTDNEGWTEHMGFEVLGEGGSWRPWSYRTDLGDGLSGPTNWTESGLQIGGYRVKYNVSQVGEGKGSFEFFTVRGAGHMVPSDAPAQGLTLFARFLDTPLPQFSLPLPPSPSPSVLNCDLCFEPHNGGGARIIALVIALLVLIITTIILCRENRLLKTQALILNPTPNANGVTLELPSVPSPLLTSTLTHSGSSTAPGNLYRAVNVREDSNEA